jgi:hypothetical protein
LFNLSNFHQAKNRCQLSAIVPFVVAIFFELYCFSMYYPIYGSQIDAPVAEKIDKNTIVWADIYGGYFVLQNGVYSAKIAFANEETQDYMIEAMQTAGVRQLFSDCSQSMHKIIVRMGSRLALIGKAHGRDVYELTDT